MVTGRRLAVAALLLAAARPGLADSGWDCAPTNGAAWECTSKATPSSTRTETVNGTNNSIQPATAPSPADTAPAPGPVPVDTQKPVEPIATDTGTRTQDATTGQDAAGSLPEDADEMAADSVDALTADPDTDPADTDTRTDDPETAVQPATTVAEAPRTRETLPATADEPDPDMQRWSQCPPAPVPAYIADIDNTETVDLQADNIHASSARVFTLSGDAMIRYGEQQLRASNITYTRTSGELAAEDGVTFAGPSLVVTADSALIETAAERGRLNNIAFTVPGQHARGQASTLGFEGTKRLYLDKASYTACPPGNRDWLLSAKKIEIDQTKGTGVARNAKVTFKHVPLLYTPYISFPLDQRRKSGLLFPKIGTTDETGLDISMPWYWNIAPNRDLTLIPRLMTDRGVMLGSEFRYLTRHSSGSIKGELLPGDKEFANQDRSLVSVQHRGNPVPRLSTSVQAGNVSDTRYFEDFGNSLVQTSQTSLERTAQATWHGNNWLAALTVQDFQNIDSTITSANRPYKQLPQIVLNATPQKRVLGIQASADAELNHFTHSDNTVVTGNRFDVMPRFSLPVERPGWYIEPAVAVRHTAYQLDKAGAGMPTNPTRTLPLATLDMGTFFERTGSWSDRPYIQTLEPRLFYLYIPHKDQDGLPIFDTENYDQNFWSLFRENRFSGPDRMGDANQLAVALSSRIVDPASGRELMSASFGSLLYFRDRTVTLPGETIATDNSSDLIAELNVALSRRWRASGEIHWNPHTSTMVRNNYQLQYRAGPRRLLNMGYRFRDGLQEQVDASFLWPIGRAWHAVGRWYYALDGNETIEALGGLGYERCCWGVQILARSYINDDSLTRNNAVFIQLELKGLGKLGSSVDDALERGILGFQSAN